MLTLDKEQPKIPLVDLSRDGRAYPSSRLWSLWDMIRFAPDEFLNLSAFLELMAIPGDLDLTRLRSLKQFDMQELKESARKLGLQVTVKHTQEILDRIGVIANSASEFGRDKVDRVQEVFRDEARPLADTLRRDLSTKLFMAITSEQDIGLFENPAPFNSNEINVNERFPDAVYDMQEAANCLALSRPGACVFHLMRVLEVGMMYLAEDLEVKWNFHEWQNVINNRRQKISEIEHGNLVKSGNAREDKRYYSGLATQFEHFKDAWRNHAIHVHGVFYDETKAQIVYLSVREFMRELAKRFSSVSASAVSRTP